MNDNFVEKYALKAELYATIKSDLNLTPKAFHDLTQSLSEEITIARKVRQLYLRKSITGVTIEAFYNWWIEQEKKCCYCDITPVELEILFSRLEGSNKRPTRGKTLELERRISSEQYDNIQNLSFCCYMCNNAKSDFFSEEHFKPIGKAIKTAWQGMLDEFSKLQQLPH